MKKIGLVVIIWVFLLALGVWAQELKFETISLKANQIEYDGNNNCFQATGNPTLTSPEGTISGLKITVFLDKSGNELGRLEAMGKVNMKLKYGGKDKERQLEANCEQAVIHHKADKLVLTDKAKVVVRMVDSNQVATLTGNKITIYLKDNKIISEEGTELVITTKVKGEEQVSQ